MNGGSTNLPGTGVVFAVGSVGSAVGFVASVIGLVVTSGLVGSKKKIIF